MSAKTMPKGVIAAARAIARMGTPEFVASPIGQVATCVACVAHVQAIGGVLAQATRAVADDQDRSFDAVYAEYLIAFHASGHEEGLAS
ncbi:MAG: hypothetical protein AB7O86_05690 [Porticoccaceae bacterium]